MCCAVAITGVESLFLCTFEAAQFLIAACLSFKQCLTGLIHTYDLTVAVGHPLWTFDLLELVQQLMCNNQGIDIRYSLAAQAIHVQD